MYKFMVVSGSVQVKKRWYHSLCAQPADFLKITAAATATTTVGTATIATAVKQHI